MKKFDIEEVKEFIRNSSETSKIYIGADSECYRNKDKVWYADYTVAIVIHKDGNKGGKVFGEVSTERIFDKRKDKPSIRLMNEVIKAAQMYLNLEEAIGERHFEVHLDISSDVMHGSSCVVNEAVGYIRGMCNVVPMIKPDAFAASYCADRLKELIAA